MKVGDLCRILGTLDPGMDLNDLRECATTGSDDVEALRGLIDDRTDNWEEYAAELLTKVVIPLLLEQRDLLLMPASDRAWSKPADMARKVAEQVRLAEQRLADVEAAMRAGYEQREKAAEEAAEVARLDCQRREREASDAVAAARAECGKQVALARAESEEAVARAAAEFQGKLARLSGQHIARAEQEATRRREETANLQKAHANKVKGLESRLHDSERAVDVQKGLVPSRQAEAASAALLKGAETAERLAQLRLSQVPGRGRIVLFRDRDLDVAMLRVEADGLKLAAKRLRRMSEEATEKGRWPIEFACGEEVQAPDPADEAEPDEEQPDAERRVAETEGA